MAIKGKKKSQSRGSQARRRPAGAPRPASVRREHVSWYRTSGGRVAVAVIAALVLSSIAGIVAAVNSSSNRAESRRDRLDAYTSNVRAFALQIADPATQMTQMSAIPPELEPEFISELRKQSNGWIETLTGARAEAAQSEPPAGLGDVNRLLTESLLLYKSSAESLLLATRAKGDVQTSLVRNAVDQHERAGNIFISAVGLIDREREREGLNPSGIGHPAQTGTFPQPTPQASPTEEPSEDQ